MENCTQVLDDSFFGNEEEPRLGRLKVGCLVINEESHDIFTGENVIGRDELSDIVIRSGMISNKHAVIEVEDWESHFIYDCGSTNKTRLGKSVLKPNVKYFLQGNEDIWFANYKSKYTKCEKPREVEPNEDSGSETGSESMLVGDPVDFDDEEETSNLQTNISYERKNESGQIIDESRSIAGSSMCSNTSSFLQDKHDASKNQVVDGSIDDSTDDEDDFFVLPSQTVKEYTQGIIEKSKASKIVDEPCTEDLFNPVEVAKHVSKKQPGQVNCSKNDIFEAETQDVLQDDCRPQQSTSKNKWNLEKKIEDSQSFFNTENVAIKSTESKKSIFEEETQPVILEPPENPNNKESREENVDESVFEAETQVNDILPKVDEIKTGESIFDAETQLNVLTPIEGERRTEENEFDAETQVNDILQKNSERKPKESIFEAETQVNVILPKKDETRSEENEFDVDTQVNDSLPKSSERKNEESIFDAETQVNDFLEKKDDNCIIEAETQVNDSLPKSSERKNEESIFDAETQVNDFLAKKDDNCIFEAETQVNVNIQPSVSRLKNAEEIKTQTNDLPSKHNEIDSATAKAKIVEETDSTKFADVRKEDDPNNDSAVKDNQSTSFKSEDFEMSELVISSAFTEEDNTSLQTEKSPELKQQVTEKSSDVNSLSNKEKVKNISDEQGDFEAETQLNVNLDTKTKKQSKDSIHSTNPEANVKNITPPQAKQESNHHTTTEGSIECTKDIKNHPIEVGFDAATQPNFNLVCDNRDENFEQPLQTKTSVVNNISTKEETEVNELLTLKQNLPTELNKTNNEVSSLNDCEYDDALTQVNQALVDASVVKSQAEEEKTTESKEGSKLGENGEKECKNPELKSKDVSSSKRQEQKSPTPITKHVLQPTRDEEENDNSEDILTQVNENVLKQHSGSKMQTNFQPDELDKNCETLQIPGSLNLNEDKQKEKTNEQINLNEDGCETEIALTQVNLNIKPSKSPIKVKSDVVTKNVGANELNQSIDVKDNAEVVNKLLDPKIDTYILESMEKTEEKELFSKTENQIKQNNEVASLSESRVEFFDQPTELNLNLLFEEKEDSGDGLLENSRINRLHTQDADATELNLNVYRNSLPKKTMTDSELENADTQPYIPIKTCEEQDSDNTDMEDEIETKTNSTIVANKKSPVSVSKITEANVGTKDSKPLNSSNFGFNESSNESDSLLASVPLDAEELDEIEDQNHISHSQNNKELEQKEDNEEKSASVKQEEKLDGEEKISASTVSVTDMEICSTVGDVYLSLCGSTNKNKVASTSKILQKESENKMSLLKSSFKNIQNKMLPIMEEDKNKDTRSSNVKNLFGGEDNALNDTMNHSVIFSHPCSSSTPFKFDNNVKVINTIQEKNDQEMCKTPPRHVVNSEDLDESPLLPNTQDLLAVADKTPENSPHLDKLTVEEQKRNNLPLALKRTPRAKKLSRKVAENFAAECSTKTNVLDGILENGPTSCGGKSKITADINISESSKPRRNKVTQEDSAEPDLVQNETSPKKKQRMKCNKVKNTNEADGVQVLIESVGANIVCTKSLSKSPNKTSSLVSSPNNLPLDEIENKTNEEEPENINKVTRSKKGRQKKTSQHIREKDTSPVKQNISLEPEIIEAEKVKYPKKCKSPKKCNDSKISSSLSSKQALNPPMKNLQHKENNVSSNSLKSCAENEKSTEGADSIEEEKPINSGLRISKRNSKTEGTNITESKNNDACAVVPLKKSRRIAKKASHETESPKASLQLEHKSKTSKVMPESYLLKDNQTEATKISENMPKSKNKRKTSHDAEGVSEAKKTKESEGKDCVQEVLLNKVSEENEKESKIKRTTRGKSQRNNSKFEVKEEDNRFENDMIKESSRTEKNEPISKQIKKFDSAVQDSPKAPRRTRTKPKKLEEEEINENKANEEVNDSEQTDEQQEKITRNKRKLKSDEGHTTPSKTAKSSKSKNHISKAEESQEDDEDSQKGSRRTRVKPARFREDEDSLASDSNSETILKPKRRGRNIMSDSSDSVKSLPEEKKIETVAEDLDFVKPNNSRKKSKQSETAEESVINVKSRGRSRSKVVAEEVSVGSRSRSGSQSSQSSLKSDISMVSSFSSPRRSIKRGERVLFTGLTNPVLEANIKKLGGSVVDCVTECSVLVTDKVRRTVKFLCVLAQGKPIVSPEWITHSWKCCRFEDPMNHLLMDTESQQKFGFNLVETLKSSKKQPLLAGYSVHATASVKPPPDDIKSIVESCGGTYLTKIPAKWPELSVVISNPDDKALWKKLKVKNITPPVVSTEMLLSGVLQYRIDFQSHKLL